MTIEEQLKKRILERFKSVNAFAHVLGLPYSTMDSIINRENGVRRASVDKIIDIFNALDLDVESIETGTLTEKESPAHASQRIENKTIYGILVAKGFIQDGYDLTDADLKFLKAVVASVSEWFK